MPLMFFYCFFMGLVWADGEVWPLVSEPVFEVPETAEVRGALVVAIEKYQYLDSQPGAEKNGLVWKKQLLKGLGLSSSKVFYLSGKKATRSNIKRAIRRLRKTDSGGQIWVYFTGHAIANESGQDAWLLPFDSKEKRLKKVGISVHGMLRDLALKQHTVVAFLDTDFMGKKPDGSALFRQLHGRMLLNNSFPRKSTIFRATANNERAMYLDNPNRSAFGYLSLGGLLGWADQNSDGVVTVSELEIYSRQSIKRLLPNHIQHPSVYASDQTLILSKSQQKSPDFTALLQQSTPKKQPSEPSEPAIQPKIGSAKSKKSANGEMLQKDWLALQNSKNIASLRDFVFDYVDEVSPANGSKVPKQLSTAHLLLQQLVDEQQRTKPQEMVRSKDSAQSSKVRSKSKRKSKKGANEKSRLQSYQLVTIPKGSFRMGNQYGQFDEEPIRNVQIRHDVVMMKSEITQSFYRKIKHSSPSYFRRCGGDCPVETVTWFDAVRFANILSKKEGLEPCYQFESLYVVTWPKGPACTGWRLPTEAEWEFAARRLPKEQGNSVPGIVKTTYAGSNRLDEVAWYHANSGGRPHSVCEKHPNPSGLCDMSGNVYEWVWDWKSQYNPSKNIDPVGPKVGLAKVIRGGSWVQQRSALPITFRRALSPESKFNFVGFRLCRTVQ